MPDTPIRTPEPSSPLQSSSSSSSSTTTSSLSSSAAATMTQSMQPNKQQKRFSTIEVIGLEEDEFDQAPEEIQEENLDEIIAFNPKKPAPVARVTEPKAFLPEYTTQDKINRYSWESIDERETNLPKANHLEISIHINDICGLYCCNNLLIIEGLKECTVFTGKL